MAQMKLMKDNLCWKCQLETGTFLHCIWEYNLVKPFWKQVMDVLGCWYASEISLTSKLSIVTILKYLMFQSVNFLLLWYALVH
uniref:Uncharacterized protein n=1 Tax=Cyprinus carpio carpio TaxID=630221 RepID=A0A9J7XUS9_CYPCA